MRVHYNCIGIKKRKYIVIQKENIYVFNPEFGLKLHIPCSVHNWLKPVCLITKCHFIKTDCSLSRAPHTQNHKNQENFAFFSLLNHLDSHDSHCEEIVEPSDNLPSRPWRLYSAYLKCLPLSANVHINTGHTQTYYYGCNVNPVITGDHCIQMHSRQLYEDRTIVSSRFLGRSRTSVTSSLSGRTPPPRLVAAPRI